MTRRALIKGGSVAALTHSIGAMGDQTTVASELPVLRFGVIADPQFAPAPPNISKTRYYCNSLWKLSEAIERFNQEDLSFVITLGDLIDRYWDSYQYTLPLYDRIKHERYFLLGNHDFEVPEEYLASILRTVGMTRSYYDFAKKGYRFLVLDGNEISLFALPSADPRRKTAQQRLDTLRAQGAANAQPWNGSLSDIQFAWLKAQLEAAERNRERVILFNHYPVFPDNPHNMWDSDRVVNLLRDSNPVVAYFNGHNHAGNYGILNGRHFLNFKGMVETAIETCYAIVEIFHDRLEVHGFGREESRTLYIKA